MPASMIKKLLSKFSFTKQMLWSMLPNGVYCFNYHRIGNTDETPFDPNVFSCTKTQFDNHLQFFKQQFVVISMPEFLDLVKQEKVLDQRYALITFDDGYADNYLNAFPLLQQYQMSATFFVTTNFVGLKEVPWWDEIAWIAKNSTITEIKLPHWQSSVSIKSSKINKRIKLMLKALKADKQMSMDDKLVYLRQATGVNLPDPKSMQSLFMDWQQLKEMVANGMTVGSHCCSHAILSHLTTEEQQFELEESKSILQTQLDNQIDVIAYPVGGSSSFNQKTIELCKLAGYDAGFTFISGVIGNLGEDCKFQFARIPVDANCSVEKLKETILKVPYVK